LLGLHFAALYRISTRKKKKDKKSKVKATLKIHNNNYYYYYYNNNNNNNNNNIIIIIIMHSQINSISTYLRRVASPWRSFAGPLPAS
jgi:hypothetical protein